MRALPAMLLALGACNPDPGAITQGVGYRDGLDGGANSGERGTVKITEVMWSGSVKNDGTWDPTDVFIELRNEGARPVNLSGWRIELEGASERTFIIPTSDIKLNVNEHRFIAAKADGCFVDPDWVIPELALPYGDPFRLTLLDSDERLMEPAGSRDMPPFAGGYDLQTSRSMELIEMMFGARGTQPHAWHYYTQFEVDVPNNTQIRPECQERTLASPGKPNSPDYSGAFATGGLE